MLAAALGIKRNEAPEKLKPLSELRFGVRADKEGKLLKDFHMVHFAKTSDVTERYYLSDAVFLAALESDNTGYLNELAASLQSPVYPLYLGRKSCPPTLPVVIGVREGTMTEVLKTEPFLCENRRRTSCRIVYETASDGIPVQDFPVTFSQLHRQHMWRMKKEEIISVGEHDPFAECEV